MNKPEKQGQRIIHTPDAMWKAVRKAAKAEGVTMSAWIRMAILRALRRDARD